VRDCREQKGAPGRETFSGTLRAGYGAFPNKPLRGFRSAAMLSVRCLAAIIASRPPGCWKEEVQSPPSHQQASCEERDYYSGEIGRFAGHLNKGRLIAW
jgi:hypothetical protein